MKISILLSALLLGTTAQATDFSSMSTEDLADMRSQAQYFNDEQRAQYQNEMRNRMQGMSMEERNQFKQTYGMGGNGGSRQGSGNGPGSQNRYRYGQSNGGGNGSGNQYRYGQGAGGGRGQHR